MTRLSYWIFQHWLQAPPSQLISTPSPWLGWPQPRYKSRGWPGAHRAAVKLPSSIWGPLQSQGLFLTDGKPSKPSKRPNWSKWVSQEKVILANLLWLVYCVIIMVLNKCCFWSKFISVNLFLHCQKLPKWLTGLFFHWIPFLDRHRQVTQQDLLFTAFIGSPTQMDIRPVYKVFVHRFYNFQIYTTAAIAQSF